MNIYIAYFTIFILGAIPFLEILAVIPVGVAAGLPALPVTIAAFAGNVATIWLLILMLDQVKVWMHKRRVKKGKEEPKKKSARAANIWKKHGLPGLSILSPILIGSHLGVLLAMSFGGTKKDTAMWMTGSIFVWSAATGIASHFGIEYLLQLTGREGFLQDFIHLE